MLFHIFASEIISLCSNLFFVLCTIIWNPFLLLAIIALSIYFVAGLLAGYVKVGGINHNKKSNSIENAPHLFLSLFADTVDSLKSHSRQRIFDCWKIPAIKSSSCLFDNFSIGHASASPLQVSLAVNTPKSS